MKFLKWTGIFLLVMVVIYFLGPQPNLDGINGELPTLSIPLEELDDSIKLWESVYSNIKEDNEARVVWANEEMKKTPYSIVYLHGFSASQGEGLPVHKQIAEYYNCNLFLSRLEGHGLESDSAFYSLTPQNYLTSAKKAVAVGKLIGEKVIVLGTSTGGMFGLYLAAENPDIAALILYSPLIDFADKNANLVAKPWGLNLARAIIGGESTRFKPNNPKALSYWTTSYRLEGVQSLSGLKDQIMTPETFSKVKCPVFLGYYYKNDDEQDRVVDVSAMHPMFEQLSTDPSMKKSLAFPKAGRHVICSDIKSNAWEAVRDSTLYFLGTKLGLPPADEIPEEVLRYEERIK